MGGWAGRWTSGWEFASVLRIMLDVKRRMGCLCWPPAINSNVIAFKQPARGHRLQPPPSLLLPADCLLTPWLAGTPPQLMAVPTHFFKVVLGEFKGGARGAAGAFVLPNSPIAPGVPLASFAVPIGALEEVSGEPARPAACDPCCVARVSINPWCVSAWRQPSPAHWLCSPVMPSAPARGYWLIRTRLC